MAVYIAAIFTFGLYLSAVPVKFALILRVSNRANFGAGGAIFEERFALRRARQRAGGQRRHLPWRRAERDVKKFRAAAKALRRLLRDTHLEQLCLSGRVGLPDAAQTALAIGLAQSASAALSAVFGPGRVRFDLAPDFSGGGSDFALTGIFSISAGHIMLGALKSAGGAAFESISGLISKMISRLTSGRKSEWISTPLRIS